MNSLHPNVFSKQPKTSSDCAKFADLSFQVKQLHNQNFNHPNNYTRSLATFATNHRVPGRHPGNASGINQGQWLRQNRPLIRGALPGHNAHGVGQRSGLGQQAKRHSNDVLLDDGYSLLRETSLSADVCDQQKTDIENQKYVIPMFINEHSVNGIRDTGNFLYKPGISRSGLAIWL